MNRLPKDIVNHIIKFVPHTTFKQMFLELNHVSNKYEDELEDEYFYYILNVKYNKMLNKNRVLNKGDTEKLCYTILLEEFGMNLIPLSNWIFYYENNSLEYKEPLELKPYLVSYKNLLQKVLYYYLEYMYRSKNPTFTVFKNIAESDAEIVPVANAFFDFLPPIRPSTRLVRQRGAGRVDEDEL
jgi:hypothetical protein